MYKPVHFVSRQRNCQYNGFYHCAVARCCRSCQPLLVG